MTVTEIDSLLMTLAEQCVYAAFLGGVIGALVLGLMIYAASLLKTIGGHLGKKYPLFAAISGVKAAPTVDPVEKKVSPEKDFDRD